MLSSASERVLGGGGGRALLTLSGSGEKKSRVMVGASESEG